MHLKEDTFRFKRFDIIQNQSVHRVGTDGVLLGAWVDITGVHKILDVGTGTGLIGLMLAQRSEGTASITALEPDVSAHDLAVRNIVNSGFSASIEVVNQRVQDFQGGKFDLIVCNPPFFINSLKPPVEARASQRHAVGLSFEDLLAATTSHLSQEGKLCLILPIDEGNFFMELALKFSLHLSKQCVVFSKVGKVEERYLLELTHSATNRLKKTSLTIMESNGAWTSEYKSLTREFYLKF